MLDAKAPIFYWQSDRSEHANFSAYYNFVLVRETYTNPTLRAMYFLHDFAHLLFYYPHDMASVTPREFEESVIVSEYAASNETEILAHYRVPGLRAKVLQDRRILYDILREGGVSQPPVSSLLDLRRLLVETDGLDCFFFLGAADEPVRQLLKSYATANGAWCKRRFTEIRKLANPSEYHFTREAVPSLFANKWFKNGFSLLVAERVLAELDLTELAAHCKRMQAEIVARLRGDHGIAFEPSDAYLLAHLKPAGAAALAPPKFELLASYRRDDGYRLCLTPYFWQQELRSGG